MNKPKDKERKEKKMLKNLFGGIFVWFILFATGMIYANYLEKKYDPIGYEKSHRYTPSNSNYGFCDMWMIQVIPQFISPHGCN